MDTNTFLLGLLVISFLVATIFFLTYKREDSSKEDPLKLKETNDLFESSINSLNVGFIVLNTRLEVVSINSTAKRLLCFSESGLSKSGILLDPLAVSLTCNLEDIEKQLGDKFPFKKHLGESLKSVKPFESEIEFRELFLKILISPVVTLLAGQIKVTGEVVLIEDITARKLLERSKDEFFSIASHELRTPLTSIRGNASMIKGYYTEILKKDKNLSEMVNDIHSSSIRLIEIVNDFLDTSRLEQGRMNFNISEFPLSELLKSVVDELSNLAEEKAIVLEYRIEQNFVVRADHDKVKQVLVNLVGNSIKFTEKGKVVVSASEENNMAIVRVADTGKGIDPKNQKLLFQKFQQAGKSSLTKETSRGSGLGLYISKMMIEQMGGVIKLESSVQDKGSTFAFTLPLVKK